MNLDLKKQMEWANAEYEFIADLLFQEGIPKILRSCIDIGVVRLHEIAEEREDLVAEFFQTPRHGRPRILGSLENDRDRHAFLLVLLHTVRCAMFLHERLSEQGIPKAAKEGKGRLLLRFAAVSREMQKGFPPLYPFAEDVPFGMSLSMYLDGEF